jgi:hypothetical protein
MFTRATPDDLICRFSQADECHKIAIRKYAGKCANQVPAEILIEELFHAAGCEPAWNFDHQGIDQLPSDQLLTMPAGVRSSRRLTTWGSGARSNGRQFNRKLLSYIAGRMVRSSARWRGRALDEQSRYCGHDNCNAATAGPICRELHRARLGRTAAV